MASAALRVTGLASDPPGGGLSNRSASVSGRDRFAFLAVLAVVFITHAASRNITSYDSVWTIHTAMSLIREGNLDLNEYDDRLAEQNYREVFEREGRMYLVHPPGTSIILAPLVWLADEVLQALNGIDSVREFIDNRTVEPVSMDAVGLYKGVEMVLASFVVALTSAFLFLVLRRMTSFRWSLILVFLFAFCTPAWSSASRGLWSHDIEMLIMVLTLLTITAGEKRPVPLLLNGMAMAFAFEVRPTSAIPSALLGLFMVLTLRRRAIPLVVGGLAGAIGVLSINLASFGMPLIPYYSGKLGLHPAFFEALAGSLISPNRGLLVFCPVFILALAGIRRALHSEPHGILFRFLGVIIILHWISIALFDRWIGGHSYGPRLFTDALPFLVLFLVPISEMTNSSTRMRKTLMQIAFVTLLAAGFAIHWAGANRWSAMEWNAKPFDIDGNAWRVWDSSDLQISAALRGHVREAATIQSD